MLHRMKDARIPMSQLPRIEVDATFLPTEEGGRRTMPDLRHGRYMPHLVAQSPDVRVALKLGGMGIEPYLGITFLEGPHPVVPGQPARFLLELMYYPGIDYDALQPGATFTIREGGKIVGFGTVLRRIAGDQ
jgi:translation elongation factor EF-Tu-like GTPase